MQFQYVIALFSYQHRDMKECLKYLLSNDNKSKYVL